MDSESKRSKERKEEKLSRRKFLKYSAVSIAGAIPFTLLIPSNADSVTTTEEQLRPFKEREAEFHKTLQGKLDQMQVPGRPPGLRPPPGRGQPPPKRVPYNTASDTSKNTTEATVTRCGDPPRSDDSSVDTFFDGVKTDYRTDYR